MNPDDQFDLGAYVNRVLDRQNLSRSALVQRVQQSGHRLSKATISAIEAGKANPTLEILLAIAEGLRVPPLYVLMASIGIDPENELHLSHRITAICTALPPERLELWIRIGEMFSFDPETESK